MASYSRYLGGVVLLFGCGGSATHHPSPPPCDEGGAAGASELAGAGSGLAPPMGGGGASGGMMPSVDEPSAGASGANEGGGGTKDEPPDDGSGTQLCLGPIDCTAELSCTSAVELSKLACLKPCMSDDTCFPTQRCVGSKDVPTSCFQTCEWPWDCSYEFDCVVPRNRTEYVCVPSRWARSIISSAP